MSITEINVKRSYREWRKKLGKFTKLELIDIIVEQEKELEKIRADLDYVLTPKKPPNVGDKIKEG